MAPANFSIGLMVGGRHGLEIEAAGEMEIPDSPQRKTDKPEELTTIYEDGKDIIGARTNEGNGVDISSPTTYIEYKQDGIPVDSHLVQGNEVGYSEFALTNGKVAVVRSKRTRS